MIFPIAGRATSHLNRPPFTPRTPSYQVKFYSFLGDFATKNMLKITLVYGVWEIFTGDEVH